MSAYAKVGLAAVAVVAVGAIGLAVLRSPGIGPGTSPVPSATPSPLPSATLDPRTPSPLEGVAPFLANPFGYTLPAGEDLVVDNGELIETALGRLSNWIQIRHPDPASVGWDRGLSIRSITGLRSDPCDERSASIPAGSNQQVVDFLKTVPTLVVGDPTTRTIAGQYDALEVEVQFQPGTPDCPNVWLWREPGSISDMVGREPVRMTLFRINARQVVIATFGPPEFRPKADAVIDSIQFVSG